MSKQTQDLVNQLERRVEELTKANRQLQQRAAHLEAGAQLGEAISSTPDVSTLTKKIVKIIKDTFELHHVGLYLIESSNRQAVLHQAAGRASRTMKQKGVQIPVDDEKSAIAWVTQTQKPYLSYPSDLMEQERGAFSVKSSLAPRAQSQLVLPLIAQNNLVGILDLQSKQEQAFDQHTITPLQTLSAQIAPAIEQAQTQAQTQLLNRLGARLSANINLADTLDTIINFRQHLNAQDAEVHLLSTTGEAYLKSSNPEQNTLSQTDRHALVHHTLTQGVGARALAAQKPLLIADAEQENLSLANGVQSLICLPIVGQQGHFTGAIIFSHPKANHFTAQDFALAEAIVPQLTTSLENACTFQSIENDLRETHLMLDISRNLSGSATLDEVYKALAQSITIAGADRCTLYICDELDSNNQPTYGQIVFISDAQNGHNRSPIGEGYRFPLKKYEQLEDLVLTQETLVIDNIETDERLSVKEQELFRQSNVCSAIINPLVTRSHVSGLLSIEYKEQHHFTERELALYRTLCNQTSIAIEHARQMQRTEEALAETQTLYRAGRVLAGADDLQDILQEALIEFVYSFGLDQGGITLLSSDKQFGQLMAYLEGGQLQDIEKLRFPIRDNIMYQQLLLSGQPFTSHDVTKDERLSEFKSFNPDQTIKSTLQAPMIIRGETVGWIGVDAVHDYKEFSSRDIDLARAMADQIAIAIQNHRLLEQTERRAEQLRAVAKVGEAVTGLMELDEVLKITVNLIRDRFGFYHVSTFLLDEQREWAVVRASTGEVGKIMVERPHRLGVGSNSIVGFVTANARPRIALDVGQDAVHFNNPLLPDTRSEMALPLISRGEVIGALDVQSVEPNAFTNDDVEVLQIMTDQVVAAIENARLFEQTQRRLNEQAMLYRIGTKIGGTLKLQETTDILVAETAEALDVAECVLSLLEEDNTVAYIISDYVQANSKFKNGQGKRFNIDEFTSWPQILANKQEFILHADDPGGDGWEFEYLKKHQGTALAVVPVLLRNQVIGGLEVYDNKPGRRFTQEDISLLDSIALQAANAIENARLYESAQESQAFMKAIIDQIPDPIFIKDKEHKWVVVNTAFAQGILGQPEEKIIGHSDHGFLSKEEAEWLWKYDDETFETGQIQELEETITDFKGRERALYTRKIPLTVSQDETTPEYLVGIINDITERKQREAERERLIKETRRTLARTQTLYRISHILSTAAQEQTTYETVLGEYLRLLNLKQGSLMLFDEATSTNVARARFINGQAVEPNLTLTLEEDRIFQYLKQEPNPLIISDPHTHPLTKNHQRTRGQQQATAMLFIPLLIREKLIGSIVIDATEEGYVFNQNDVEIGETIADQLTIWLENRRLLAEAQYRTERLQTAAEVSRAASSYLDVNELINNSVNIIRDQFDFYYVGLFLVDEERKFAVLRAGTGQAGRIQLENNHQLEIGGESMIGWSIANRKARIALDVGEEAVHFKNPILPDTHSEMALPLISRDTVLGALTVQSVERAAFSSEDITLLQTMADQLANAIENANLFTQTQNALAEAEAFYQITQEISAARDEESVYQIAIDALAESGIDSCAIYMYEEDPGQSTTPAGELMVEQKAVWAATGQPAVPNGLRLKAADFVIEQLVPRQGWFLIEDVEKDSRVTGRMRQIITDIGIQALMVLPLSTHQGRLGFLLAAQKTKGKKFTEQQIRFFTTITQQLVTALENLRLLDDSQRRVRREEIIREITLKIKNAVDIDDIMKTTVTELSKVLGTTRGHIRLGVEDPAARPQIQPPPNGSKGNGNSTESNTAQSNEESKDHDQ